MASILKLCGVCMMWITSLGTPEDANVARQVLGKMNCRYLECKAYAKLRTWYMDIIGDGPYMHNTGAWIRRIMNPSLNLRAKCHWLSNLLIKSKVAE